MSLRIVETGWHQRSDVDPFGQLPCSHERVEIHISNGQHMGDDILECSQCDFVTRLADLFVPLQPPPGLIEGWGAKD